MDELLLLCVPLATNNSYCIVEDTILKTPQDALRNFWRMKESSDFCIDTDREYMGITQHRGGYLRRIHTHAKRQVSANRIQAYSAEFSRRYQYMRGNHVRNLYNQRLALDIATGVFINITEE